MRRNIALSAFAFLFLALAVEPALAQKIEVHPYAGGYFPGHWRDQFQMKREGLYGIQAGGIFADRWEVEGNFGYVNHFLFKENTAPKTRAVIWEVGPSVNLYSNLLQKVFPFVTVKAGGLTSWVSDASDGTNIAPPGSNPAILSGHPTFFQFSYGGGLKAWNLFGPVGLRANVQGRTIPNFFGNSTTWLETTGGLTLNWGER
jgi:hypothetical protein